MADVPSLTPPNPGLSASVTKQNIEPCSSKRPENVKITTLYRCAGLHFRAATQHVNNFARIQYSDFGILSLAHTNSRG